MSAEELEPDAKYIAWRRSNPNRYVLNTNRSCSPSHSKLHRANCDVLENAIATTKPGNLTGARYYKVGADSPKEAMAWLRRMRSDFAATYCHECCEDIILARGGDSVGNG
jgi:hypothetical protein